MKALKEGGREITAFGIGGPKLEREGLRVIVPASELLAMGFAEILSRLPRIFSALAALTEVAREEKPDLAVVIDYPDFHFRLAARLTKLGVPLVYYIPPKTWVWRKSRIARLRALFKRVLCILPFEEEFYRRENVNALYVGNPLLDELPLEMSRAQARAQLGLEADEKILVFMPGSRPSELRRHLVLGLEAVQRAVAFLRSKGAMGASEDLRVLIPLPETSAEILMDAEARVEAWLKVARPGGMQVTVSRGDAPICQIAADCGVIKSGTSTLEAGILGCPHLVIYKPNWVTSFIFKYFIRYKGSVGLVNLVAGEAICPELISENATVKTIAGGIVTLFTDAEAHGRMLAAMKLLRAKLLQSPAHRHPSKLAASEIFKLLDGIRGLR